MVKYIDLNKALKEQEIALTPAELHGFLTGLACSEKNEESWQDMLFQFTHNDLAYPTILLDKVKILYNQIKQDLSQMEAFHFQLYLPENVGVFQQADALSEWVNHFLLGLGISIIELDKEEGDIAEGLNDLQEIGKLTYDENDDEEELAMALEEVSEYVRTLVMLFYTHFHHIKNHHSRLH